MSDGPVTPNVGLNLALGVLLGVVVGATAAVLRELLDTSIRSAESASSVAGANILATVPWDSEVAKASPAVSSSEGQIAEAMRVLRTNLQFVNLDSVVGSVVVTSALPNEGKTLTTAQLAISIAHTGRSVMAIDCDFRNPQLAAALGLEQSIGLSSVLVSRISLEEAVQEHHSGLAVLSTGRIPPNPAEVLQTQAMRDLIAEACKQYDFVLMDAPPLLPVADGAILVSQADAVILVVANGRTRREPLRLAAERIESVGGRLAGVVLNMVKFRGDQYGYGYGYGSLPDAQDAKPARRRGRSRVGSRRSAPTRSRN